MHERIVPPTIGPSSVRGWVVFGGDDGEFRRLVTRGALLELMTFGFYRFWLATNIRRHLWTNTSVDGDALEYTGTGRELLIGFLFALAILAPIYIAYFAIGIEAERWQAFAGVPFGVVFYALYQFAIYRARRYRLTRTLWRGVRFWMMGSGLAYMARALGWTLLTVVTLGLAYPWREAALERYKLSHTFYGDLPGHFRGQGWVFFKRGWWLWLFAWLPTVLSLLGGSILKDMGLPAAGKIMTSGAVLAPYAFLPFIYGAFKATEWKWWAESLRFGRAPGELHFASDLRRGALVKNIWKMIGIYILVTIPFAVLAGSIALGVDAASIAAGHKPMPITLIVLGALGYITYILTLGVVWRIYMVQRIWKIVVSSIKVENLSAADHVTAKGAAASAIGEGLADSLDVAGF